MSLNWFKSSLVLAMIVFLFSGCGDDASTNNKEKEEIAEDPQEQEEQLPSCTVSDSKYVNAFWIPLKYSCAGNVRKKEKRKSEASP